jgi:neutral ceramidase
MDVFPRRELLRSCLALPLAVGRAALPRQARVEDRAVGLRVGAARVDITPETAVCLAGYSDPATRVSTGVHDRLYARAFAFSAGAARLVIVSCDLCSLQFGDMLRRRIGDALGLRLEELLLCATHTHSGPLLTLHPSYPANVAYTNGLAASLTEVVRRALGARQPARLALARGQSAVGISRRKPIPGGGIEMAPNPGGATDPEVLVVQAIGRDGRPFATLFDYACHSRSLRAGNRLLSGDVLGLAEQEAERTLGGPIVGAFAGASGDIDPVSVVDGFEVAGSAAPETVRLGRLLGEAVVSAARRAEPLSATPGIRSASARIALPPKTPGAQKAVDVTAVRLGEAAIVGLDCEASTEIGLAIKAASPMPATMVVSHCNGWAGYLPVAHQYAEGGYEVEHTGFAPDAAALLVTRVLGMLRRL